MPNTYLRVLSSPSAFAQAIGQELRLSISRPGERPRQRKDRLRRLTKLRRKQGVRLL